MFNSSHYFVLGVELPRYNNGFTKSTGSRNDQFHTCVRPRQFDYRSVWCNNTSSSPICNNYAIIETYCQLFCIMWYGSWRWVPHHVFSNSNFLSGDFKMNRGFQIFAKYLHKAKRHINFILLQTTSFAKMAPFVDIAILPPHSAWATTAMSVANANLILRKWMQPRVSVSIHDALVTYIVWCIAIVLGTAVAFSYGKSWN